VEQVSTIPEETIPLGTLLPETTPAAGTDTQGKADVTPPNPFPFALDTHAHGEKQPTVRVKKASSRNLAYGAGLVVAVAAAVIVGCLLWYSNSPGSAQQKLARPDSKLAASETNKPSKTKSKVSTFGGEDFKFEIPSGNLLPADAPPNNSPAGNRSDSNRPTQLPDELMPKNVRWNPIVREKVDPVFFKGSLRGAGRVVYSEIDTAIEQNCEGQWTIGSNLTKDGAYWQFIFENGELTARPLSPEAVVLGDLHPDAIQRSIDDRFQTRVQPVITFASGDLIVDSLDDGGQQLTISLLCKKLNDVVFDTAQIVVEFEPPGQEDAPVTKTGAHYIYVDWTAPPTGWQEIGREIEKDRLLQPGTKVRIHLNAFAYQPRPSFYRLSNIYELTLKAQPK
jgi:hypothetical protein